MDDANAKSHSRGAALIALFVIGSILLIYMPLILAGLESLTFGTRKVEDFCEVIGVHDLLSAVYDNTVLLFFN